MIVGPEIDQFLRGEFVRWHVTAKRPAGGQRPDVNEQAGDELVMGKRRVKHGLITRIHVRDGLRIRIPLWRGGRGPQVLSGL
jgi:hypothetical protein